MVATVAILAAGCQSTSNSADKPNPCVTQDDPSGVSVDPSDEPGWRTAFTDTFNRCTTGDDWTPYSGSPRGSPASGPWKPENVAVGNSQLTLSTKRSGNSWSNGGVSSWKRYATYGKWEVRFRATKSDEMSFHILLWPKDEQWPPEIDIAESVEGTRSAITSFVHWKDANGANQKASHTTKGDFTAWHTVAVEWLPDRLTLLVDGKVVSSTTEKRVIPTVPMWLALQTQSGACEVRAEWGLPKCGPNALKRNGSLVVDWVKMSVPAGESSPARATQ